MKLTINPTFRNLWLSIKRLKVFIGLPFSQHTRKFDFYSVIYPSPISTIGIGITIPFILCIYLSLGTRMNWWGKTDTPVFIHATTGLWVYVGRHFANLHLKTGCFRCFKEINYARKR